MVNVPPRAIGRTLLIVLTLLMQGCSLFQKLRDDKLARLLFEEQEMLRSRTAVQAVLAAPDDQHATLFVGRDAINKALSMMDGSAFLLQGPDAAHPKVIPTWLHIQRIRIQPRTGVALAQIDGTVVRDWARVRVVGDVMIVPELDPQNVGDARLRIRLRNLRPTFLFGGVSIAVWGLLRDVVEMGVSSQFPQLDPQFDALPIQLVKLQGFHQNALSQELENHENFLNVRFRVDTPEISFSATQIVQTFFLDNGLYVYVRYVK
jgi:hypothetical protein